MEFIVNFQQNIFSHYFDKTYKHQWLIILIVFEINFVQII